MKIRPTKMQGLMPQRRICGKIRLSRNLDPALVAWYRFREGTGNVINDSSKQENTGTNDGATWTDDTGRGTKLVFDNIDNLVIIPASASLLLTNAMTITAWAKLTVDAGYGTIVRVNWAALGSFIFMKNIGANGKWVFAQVDSLGQQFAASNDDANDFAGVWTHLVGVKDGNTLLFYVNSVVQATTAVTDTDLELDHAWRIGASTVATFFGALDDIRVYNRALRASEIQAIYNQTRI